MNLPPEHAGHTKTRLWHKVRWMKSPDSCDPSLDRITGRVDLLMDEDLKDYKDFVEILRTERVETCKTGLALGIGRVEEKDVDEWLEANKSR